MEEQQVTVDGVTYNLPEPFLVMATQNPIEYEGTYPLPESQLDRFFMRIIMGYTSRADELEVIESHLHTQPIEELEQVIGIEDLLQIQEEIKDIYVDAVLREYIVDLVRATRDHREIYLGASTRGSLALFRGSQVLASFRGRDYVIPDDVKYLCIPTLAHRLIVSPAARIRNVDTREIVQEILDTIAVPGATAA